MNRGFIFDVFGTCVDWRTSVAREVARHLPRTDAAAFADAWRAEYQPAMARVRDGKRGYVPLETLHRENLEKVAGDLGVVLKDADGLNGAWERLDPWGDVPGGLAAIRAHGLVAACSNGSIAMMARLARHAGLHWDAILGAEVARAYKPDPIVYETAAGALGLPVRAVTMVAAHNDDLAAARAAGLGTAFVARPAEHGPGQESDLAPQEAWDFVAADFHDLARQLGARAGG